MALRQVLLLATALLCGCPKHFDVRSEKLPPTENRAAEAEYQNAIARAAAGDHKEALRLLEEFVAKYPTDPLIPATHVRAGEAALALHDDVAAEKWFSLAAAEVRDRVASERAQYLLGRLLHKKGEHQKSFEFLLSFSSRLAPGDEATELHAILADDALHIGKHESALTELELFYVGARPVEREYIGARASEVVAALSAEEASAWWSRVDKESLAAAYLSRRLGGEQILREAARARQRFSLEISAAPVAAKAKRLVGLLIPVSGKSRALGDRALRGAMLGLGLAESRPRAIALEMRDTRSDAATVAALVEELAGVGVAAIIGPPGRAESQAAAAKAEVLGIPFLALASDDIERRGMFKMVRPRAAAVTALAEQMAKAHVRTVAILAPSSATGKQLASTFSERARALGLRVSLDLRYAENATTFVDPAKKILADLPDALFVPAPATQLQLIAPQLASSGVTAMPGISAPRTTKLYATADGLNEKLFLQTGKYLQGAILAPVFFPTVDVARVSDFVARYHATYSEDPSSLDALAYDAAMVLGQAVGDAVEMDRGQMLTVLPTLHAVGATGPLEFSPGGDRVGAPTLLIVEGTEMRLVK